jgi:hypothetical protein
MPIGLFKTADQSVQVDYEGFSIPVTRSKYGKAGYKPPFDELPLKPNIWPQKRSRTMPQGPKCPSEEFLNHMNHL